MNQGFVEEKVRGLANKNIQVLGQVLLGESDGWIFHTYLKRRNG